MTSDAPTNAWKHVMTNIACVHSRRYTENSDFWLAHWWALLCYVIVHLLSDQTSIDKCSMPAGYLQPWCTTNLSRRDVGDGALVRVSYLQTWAGRMLTMARSYVSRIYIPEPAGCWRWHAHTCLVSAPYFHPPPADAGSQTTRHSWAGSPSLPVGARTNRFVCLLRYLHYAKIVMQKSLFLNFL